ncbi:hypothetical protein VE01_08931 [Pseudogymnoascus verrucosus]|uniref:Zn(2)-C6 fungal-type domain-containing protein n=1 Tax=Pseudogymnoascus verrucosus TaxID=342668 RepID=A0A1B8GAN0_9PEZI|nr:uncharacterized protein VE01_08931 [Pseudogymnoascus verrucosus]OBT92880.1 hypothetical protein VE01_08931 [Pseudogymnoascus verrucosus]
MPQTSEGRLRPGEDLKKFSCLTCRQRKVRCDRHNPCSHCVKAATQCSFIAPVRGKRKLTKPPKEGLHSKLKRYEEMLKAYGANIEQSDYENLSDADVASEPDVEMTEAEGAKSHKEGPDEPFTFDKSKSRLVSKNGSSRYFDNEIWSNIGDEFHHPDEAGFVECVGEMTVRISDVFVDTADENGLLLGTYSKIDNITSLHLSSHILKRVFDIFVDRVDPLVKLLHLPTFWTTLTNAVENPHDVLKSVEALIFGFYLMTISSLDEDECRSLFGEDKSIVFTRYRIAARQTLMNAGFLKTTSLVTLQAFMMFLMGMKGCYQSDTMFILSGVAVRLARRMGLHRDGTSLNLSPFDTEIRRRLWWMIVFIDCRTSDFSGTRPSMDLFLSDTKKPLNVEDEDLTPDMVEPPPERTGITSIVLSLIRFDIIDFLRKVKSQHSYDVGWENLTGQAVTPAERDNLIKQVEGILETKYLRYFDPSNPLHYFSSVLARSAICKMNLYAYNPRQFANCGAKVPQRARDIIFTNGMKLLEYGNLLHRDPNLRKFSTQTSSGYIWDTLLYVLIEARNRKIGPDVDRAWKLIGEAFENYPLIFAQATEALYAALGNWTLQVWDDCVAARNAEGIPEPLTPYYIEALRRCRTPASKPDAIKNLEGAMGSSVGNDKPQSQRHDGNYSAGFEPIESYDFSSILSFDLEPNEWAQWERLLSAQGM